MNDIAKSPATVKKIVFWSKESEFFIVPKVSFFSMVLVQIFL